MVMMDSFRYLILPDLFRIGVDDTHKNQIFPYRSLHPDPTKNDPIVSRQDWILHGFATQ